MKKLLALALSALSLAPALAQPSVGVSIGINQPGMYGQINIGDYPQPPRLIQAQPIMIAPAPGQQRPVYLYVPPAHQQHWREHCHRYNACGQPVYFVQENWVRERYEERRRYEDRHRHEGRDHRERGRDDGDRRGEGRGRGGDR